MADDEQFDVAVVGCGPVGATAAHLLARAGLRVAVIEREATPHPLPRAVHIDHEVMRIFQAAGLADALAPAMRAAQGHLHIGADGAVLRYMGTAGRPRRFGWADDYFFYQPELEASLRAGLAGDVAVSLRLGTAFVGLAQDGDGVTLAVDGPDGRGALRARYVIACDGASSPVRKALGIALADLDFEEPWLVVDAEVDGPIAFPPVPGLPADADLQSLSVMLCDPRRPATIVPGRGNHRRWEFMLLPGEDDAAMRAPAVAAALVAPWLEGAPARIVRAATYRFHGLVAERWADGRVFLAGDAAHQTPPFFGQGMCHGMRDVANLAWKLALVVRGAARPALLASYQPERAPQVASVIAAAVAAGRYICERDPAAAAERDRTIRAAEATGERRTAADLIVPLNAGIVRAGDPGAGARFIQPRIGGVLLDAITGGGFALVTRPGVAVASPAGFAAIGGSTHAPLDAALAAWFDAHDVDAVLLRPDFYVYGSARAEHAAALVTDLCALIGPDERPAAAAPVARRA